MPFIANPRDEGVDPLSLRSVQHASKVQTKEVGAGVLVFDPGIQNFRREAPFVIWRNVVVEDVCDIVEIAFRPGSSVLRFRARRSPPPREVPARRAGRRP